MEIIASRRGRSGPLPNESAGVDARLRSNVRVGLTVDVVTKTDQPTGRLTRGVVAQLLTKSPTHPHGIKVRLQDGQVGRVKHIVTPLAP